MTAVHANQVVAGYLKQLEAELAWLPAGRCRELTGQISDHIGAGDIVFSIVPIGWIVGTVLVWRSQAWTSREFEVLGCGPVLAQALL